MAAIIPIVLLVIPCAIGAWLWLVLSGNGVKQAQGKPCHVPKHSPDTMQTWESSPAFRVGNRYYDSSKNRVFECIAVKGRKVRFVAFACLDSIDRDLSLLKEFGGFNKVRIDGGIETCQRGAIRADRQATEKEVADEFDLLRQFRKREAEYKPSGMARARVSVTIGDKTYTSG